MHNPSIPKLALAVRDAAHHLYMFAGALAQMPDDFRPSEFAMLNIEASANTVAEWVEELKKAVAK